MNSLLTTSLLCVEVTYRFVGFPLYVLDISPLPVYLEQVYSPGLCVQSVLARKGMMGDETKEASRVLKATVTSLSVTRGLWEVMEGKARREGVTEPD